MKKTVRVLGAGISGLLSAYYAVQKGHTVEVYERAAQAGGKIGTMKSPHGLMETAANAILADLEVETVAKNIGLSLIEKNSTAKKRYIYFAGKICRWPLPFFETLRFVYFLLCWKMGFKNVEPQKLETLKSWSDRTLGAITTQALLSPGCLGIFGVDASQLSAKLIYNYFFSKKKKQYGKLRGSIAPEQGMGQWILALESYLKSKGVRFTYHLNHLEADWIKDELVIATDSTSAAKILEFYQDSRASLLNKISTVDLVSINVFYEHRPPLQKPGFGVLFSRDEGVVPLGVLFNQDIFKQRSLVHSETWIFGSQKEKMTDHSDDFFKEQITAVRQKVWQSPHQPLEIRINRWPSAIPLYGLELEKILEDMPVKKGNISLMGNYLGEIGLNRLFHRAKSIF